MKIDSLVHRDVTSCTIHDTLERAAQLMWDHDVGCLPVIDDHGHVAGIITDRDVCMAAYTQGVPLRAIDVTTAMSKQVFSCTLGDELDSVERAMSEHQVRRMPVIDEQGHPVGMVTLNDLARASAVGQLPAAELTATLLAVTAPRPLVTSAA